MSYEKTEETTIGFDWIKDGKHEVYVRTNNPCMNIKFEEMSFLQEGRCSGCGENITEIAQNNDIAAFDTVYKIELDGKFTTQNRAKPQQYCCGHCGKPFSFITNGAELLTFIQFLPKGATC